ncbi:MAG: secondary thiamine-phosphate synthase enzyme YjbQ [Candidatus Shapirobacteria bacterium]|nr:secondary thiamine-phosphate synthase enzyme YjbQ [Candidatus Shapirobacteria bacterium]
MIKNTTIEFTSKDGMEFRDLTDEVEKFVKESEIKNGNVLIYSTHTTLAICINEKEKGIVADFKNLTDKLIPKKAYYQHNDLTKRTENLVCQSGASDCLNGHSHCTHLLMRNSETIPIIDGKMMLGIWQRIFAIELDCCRRRKVLVQVMGE